MQISKNIQLDYQKNVKKMCINQLNTITVKIQWKYNLHISVHCIILHTYLLPPYDPLKKK